LLALQRIEDESVERLWREPHTREEGVERVRDLQRNPERYYLANV
jgi:hypothetical protein